MNLAACSCLLAALAACKAPEFTHAPAGTSVRVLQAKKAEAIPTPTPVPVAPVNPPLPQGVESVTESIADYYTLGNLMMQQGKYSDAIKAYESAVKLDPSFADAWNHLAICYQNTGQSQKAVEAFKKYKAVTPQGQ